MLNIVNFVMCFYTNPVDPKKIEMFKGSKIRRFNAYKIKQDSGGLLIFYSGKIIETNFKKISDARRSLEKFSYTTGISIIKHKIVNITGALKMPFRINMNSLLIEENVEYEPELFPGIYFKYKTGKIILFHSGKYILTGFKLNKNLYSVNRSFLFQIKKFKIL